jgi:16S rRNA (uracil1498-N3)-methyltransferase
MQLFYSKEISNASPSFEFDKVESKHIFKVLRKKEGDRVHITNGKGFLFISEIISISDRKCIVKILDFQEEAPTKFKLHLAVAPTKMNDRFEWFLEKATEIGIHEITPIICEHSERKVINVDRFEKILVAAMKQSNQYFLPVLNELVSFKDFMQKKHGENIFIAHCHENQKRDLFNSLKTKENTLILIGPEGDFSEKEVKTALDKKFIPVSLGSNRLRTETAAMVATHTVILKNEL